jgi:hypothetical protein
MSKKSGRRRGKAVAADAAPPEPACRRRPRRYVFAALLACALLAATFAATRFEPVRRAVGMRPLVAEPAQGSATPQLSKEYVYAGGRLVATEEPTPAATPSPTPAGPAPANLVATASFPSASSAVVSLTWSAPASAATPSGYIVERAESRDAAGPQYAQLIPPATTVPTQSSPYIDQTAAAAKVYVYRVRAVYASGTSDYSNQDLATTVRYSGDDPLIGAGDPQGRPRSVIRAANLNELRAVIDAVRTLAGMGAAAWKSDPAPASHGSILKAHFQELRENLNQALAELDIEPLPEDSTLGPGLPVRAAHLQDVREKVR